MSRWKMDPKDRRENLRRSREPSEGEGFSTHSTKAVAKALGGRSVECTITGYCRTFVFRFPGAYLVAEEPIDHQVIYSHGDFRASIVSDLPAYFEQDPTKSLHYSIAVSLRASVRSIYEKAVEQANQQPHPQVPLFVVMEEHADVSPTVLNSGECSMIDECRIKGGREGEKALVAERTIDGSWPDFHADMSVVNVVLAAIKMEQNVTGHIEELHGSACFVNSEGQAVYIRPSPTISANPETISYLEPPDLREKADRIESMLRRMVSDSKPTASELFDSILLDKTKDDGYLRLWYLRLWQALDDAKNDLGYTQAKIDTVIAGKRTQRELTEYRNSIAHWNTGKIDYAYLSDLQRTALELLRSKYGPAS